MRLTARSVALAFAFCLAAGSAFAQGQPAHRPGRRSRRARSDAVAHLHRAHRLRRALRQAVRHRREGGHRAAARARLRDLGRRQDGHDQAPPRREVPRRRAVRRRGRQVQPRAAHEDEGLVPQARARRRRHRGGRRSADREAQPQAALLAAAGPAHRPRRHDGLAQGRRGRGRQVRPEAGLRRPLQVRRAHPAGQASWSRSSPTTGTRSMSSSTGSPTCRSSTRRCGWPTCARAGST